MVIRSCVKCSGRYVVLSLTRCCPLATLEWELGKQKEPNAESPTVIDTITPAIAMPNSSTTGSDQGSFTDINTISDNLMAYMGELTPPYLTWPTTTTTTTTTATTPTSEAPYAFISSEGLNHEYSLPSPGTKFEEHRDPRNVSPLTLCGDAKISDLMLADLCVDNFLQHLPI